MALLVQIATVLSFVTAPFYAYLNYRLVMSDQMPREHKPGKGLQLLSILGIIFLGIFALAFLLMV
jgi:Mn2+/Fe2+ NRAMP family transporter